MRAHGQTAGSLGPWQVQTQGQLTQNWSLLAGHSGCVSPVGVTFIHLLCPAGSQALPAALGEQTVLPPGQTAASGDQDDVVDGRAVHWWQEQPWVEGLCVFFQDVCESSSC